MSSKRLRVMLVSLLAVFAVSAVASASASAAPEWYVCEEGTGAGTKFTEHKCTTVSGTGKWEWIKLVGTKKVKSKNKAGVSFVFEGEAGGVKVKITCKKVKDIGTITQGAPGKDTETAEFEECVVDKPGPGLCVVSGGGGGAGTIIATVLTKLVVEGTVGDEQEPEAGKPFVTLEFANKGTEVCPLKGQAFPVTGSAVGLFSGNVLKFTKATSKLKFGGHPATIEGEAELELENEWAVTGK